MKAPWSFIVFKRFKISLSGCPHISDAYVSDGIVINISLVRLRGPEFVMERADSRVLICRTKSRFTSLPLSRLQWLQLIAAPDD